MTKALTAYHPRRCDRCWYCDEEGRCHGNDFEIEYRSKTNDYFIVWPHTEPDSFCKEYFPREHVEAIQDPALPEEAKPKKKKAKKKKKKARKK